MSPPSSSARLDVTQGPLQGQSLSLTATETVAGRETDCGLVLSVYREVSRRHARFYLRDGTWCVEDLGSTNGTFVNNVRATPSFSLTDSDMIQMGDFHACFRLSAVEINPGSQPTQYSPNPPAPPIPQPVAPMPVMPVQVVPVIPIQTYPAYPVIYPPEPPKQVALALLFSFLLVGGGQFYNGETNKGVTMLCGALLCGVAGFFTCGLTAIGCTIFWILSIVDAVQSAERINREAGWPRSF